MGPFENRLTFKQFTKTYHLGFFGRKKFAKYINTLGLSWHDIVFWEATDWIRYYLKFKRI